MKESLRLWIEDKKLILSFRNIGQVLVFEKLRPKLRRYLLKAGITKVPYELYGKIFYILVFISLSVFFLFGKSSYHSIFAIIGSILTFIATAVMVVLLGMVVMWMYYSTLIYNRTKEIEEVLPRFLEVVRINLEAGVAFDEALMNSISPEFKVLKNEIEIVAQKSMTGDDTEEALKDFASKYNSPMLHEAVDLMTVGIKGGTNMTEIMEKLVNNMNLNNYLRKKIVSSVASYVIFITMIALIISPLLFALSYNLLVIFESFGASLGTSADYLAITFNPLIDKADFVRFSQFCIATIALFSSIIIVTLKKGSVKGSWKTVPVFVAIALVVYELALKALVFVFGKLLV